MVSCGTSLRLKKLLAWAVNCRVVTSRLPDSFTWMTEKLHWHVFMLYDSRKIQIVCPPTYPFPFFPHFIFFPPVFLPPLSLPPSRRWTIWSREWRKPESRSAWGRVSSPTLLWLSRTLRCHRVSFTAPHFLPHTTPTHTFKAHNTAHKHTHTRMYMQSVEVRSALLNLIYIFLHI